MKITQNPFLLNDETAREALGGNLTPNTFIQCVGTPITITGSTTIEQVADWYTDGSFQATGEDMRMFAELIAAVNAEGNEAELCEALFIRRLA